MTLTLDPRLPVLWRTPDSLQVGVDNPPVMLTGVSSAHERMLAALALGLTPQGLALIGTEAGLSLAQVADFERRIRPALVTPEVAASACVDIDGVGPTADRLDWRLREAGLLSRRTPTHADGSTDFTTNDLPDIAVIIGDYVLAPERRGRWLRRDIPHLPIMFGDTSVTIGPFIETGAGPCLYCLELHHRDADPAWPALASQLLGTLSSAQKPFIASEVATVATRLVLRRVNDGAASSATAVVLDVDTGECRSQAWHRHQECACAGLLPSGATDSADEGADGSAIGNTSGGASGSARAGAPLSEQYLQETWKARSSPHAGCATGTTRDEAACEPA